MLLDFLNCFGCLFHNLIDNALSKIQQTEHASKMLVKIYNAVQLRYSNLISILKIIIDIIIEKINCTDKFIINAVNVIDLFIITPKTSHYVIANVFYFDNYRIVKKNSQEKK